MRFPLITRSACLLPLVLLGCGGGGGPTEPRSDYELEIRYLGTAPSAAVQQAFGRARARIEAIITDAVPATSLPTDFTNVVQCDANLTGYPDVERGVIRGLVIYVAVIPIDGAGLVLGNAGPCLVRTTSQNQPALGVMRLDEADLSSLSASRVDALVLHEMLHVVGLGTIWADNGLLAGDGTADARFTGPSARTACANVALGTTTCAVDVPVHSADGEGSAYSHWRESTFTNELMTPLLGAGASPLSAMSIQSLADLGYSVSSSPADPFTLASGLRLADPEDGPAPVVLPTPLRPKFGISAAGTLVTLPSNL